MPRSDRPHSRTSGLIAIAIEGDGFVLQCLDNEIRPPLSVVRVHARPIGIEDARDLDAQLVLAVVIEKQGFCAALAFVVTGARADGIDVAPITFCCGCTIGSP